MSLIRKFTFTLCYLMLILPALAANSNHNAYTYSYTSTSNSTLTTQAIAKQLGWVIDPYHFCGGFYVQQPSIHSLVPENAEAVGITSNGGLLSQTSTSILEGNVTVTRSGQQITANKAYLYREPLTGKFKIIDMIGDVHLSEANSLVIGKKGRYDFSNASKSLIDIIYRTSLDPHQLNHQQTVQTITALDGRRANLTAWGQAAAFSQTQPLVYELNQATYTTCPPLNNSWSVKASHIVLNKNTGRGYATHARVLIKNIPILYIPYINFSIDKQRKTGFLWPTLGVSNKWGPYLLTPFYWNMAPNYDMTITPGILTKRGFQFNDEFRYLTTTNQGYIKLSLLPNDRAFQEFQENAAQTPQYTHPVDTPAQPASVTSAELNRLLNASSTRKGFVWKDDARYNDNWSSHIDYTVVGDDYYLRDFGNTIEGISKNQLLQEGDVYYKDKHWNFTGRLQAYQTLHAIDGAFVTNSYRRFPQLILNGDYPDQKYGLEYFINNDVTHFDIRKTPGTEINKPIGNRLHTQPGISLPLYWPYLYLNPRFQIALTEYNLYQTSQTETPTNIHRAIPIFDFSSGLAFNRDTYLFRHAFLQTLEPQFYYLYIPYRNQSKIPTFDTIVNTLSYDQLFNYNRFTGIDRIGDANQLSLGITTRLIDQESGLEKVRFGVGGITYFANRRVTLCNTKEECIDNPFNPNNTYSLSPISAILNYHVNFSWSFNVFSIWNPITKQLDNSTIAFQYLPDEKHLINLGYTYGRGQDILSGLQVPDSINNLKVSDFSFAWPLRENVSMVGRWSRNWNRSHLQNLVYGLQYDTCCWAMRLVGGRAFAGFDTLNNNKPLYTNEISVQFSLKGLGDVGSGSPTGLLKGIPGYKTQFGQEL